MLTLGMYKISKNNIFCKRLPFELISGLFGAPFGPLWEALFVLWGGFVVLWEAMGSFWDALGILLGYFGMLWEAFARYLGIVGELWAQSPWFGSYDR